MKQGLRKRPPGAVRQVAALAILLILCFAVAGIGGAVTSTSVDGWYRTLIKPAFTPPEITFSIVWTVLYTMMAVAAFLVWRRASIWHARGAWLLFGSQLAVNLLWSFLFFGWHRIGLALIDAIVLFFLVAATAIAFGRISRAAGWLLVPYLAWGGFAIALNGAIWHANP